MSKQTKREYMRSVGAALSGVGLAGFAGCTSEQNGDRGVGAATDTSEAPTTETTGDSEIDVNSYDEELSYLIPEGQIDIPFWLSPKVMESFDAHGVNVSPQVTSYDRASRALSSGSAVINHVAPAEWINIVNQGESISLIGGNLVQLNSIFTLPESDIEEPQDLEGKSLGVPYMNSGTTKMVGAMLQDGYGIDIREDVNSQSASPSVLWTQLVENQELDAIIEFTGHTIKGLANDDTVQEVMSAYDYWTGKTDAPPMISSFGIRQDWLDQHPGEARAFIDAWGDGLEYAFGGNNVDQMFQQYGRLAGLTTPEERDTLLGLMDEGSVMLRPPSEWDQDLVDAQFELYSVMEETGFVESAPSRDLGVTYSELQNR